MVGYTNDEMERPRKEDDRGLINSTTVASASKD